MPELPEVETVRMQLEKYLVGHRIERSEIRNQRIVTGDINLVENSPVTGVRRFGKVLVIDLDNDYSVISHIKLTGQFIYRGANLLEPKELSKKVTGGLGGKHTHVIFHLDNDAKLYYNDFRRFGWIKIERTTDVEKETFIAKLGREFLKDITLADFKAICSKTKRNIKVLIMDQAKMAGVGNIYANDALWLAKIDPKRSASSLTPLEAESLFNAIETVLKKGLETGGASELSFVTPDGSEGDYQNHTLIYGKQGKKCTRCGAIIEKYMLGGRGTYVCPSCQTSEILML